MGRSFSSIQLTRAVIFPVRGHPFYTSTVQNSPLPSVQNSAPLSLMGLPWKWNSSGTNIQGQLESCRVQGWWYWVMTLIIVKHSIIQACWQWGTVRYWITDGSPRKSILCHLFSTTLSLPQVHYISITSPTPLCSSLFPLFHPLSLHPCFIDIHSHVTMILSSFTYSSPTPFLVSLVSP